MNSQHLAEELARKCEDQIMSDYVNSAPTPPIHERILQSMTIVELLECARQLRRIDEVSLLGRKSTCVELTNLTTKLQQLGIEI